MSSRKHIKQRRQRKQRQNLLLLVLLVGGAVLVIGAIVASAISSNQVNLKPRQIRIPEYTGGEQYDLASLGDPAAPVVIEEYSDFSCSHCRDFALGTKKLLEEQYINTGRATLVFHTVGWVTVIPPVLQTTEAAFCAGEQGSFWQFHDLIFANQENLYPSASADVSRTMETFAETLGLDMESFNACVAENRYRDVVDEDGVRANDLGVDGTPTFFINGVMLKGNQPFENFQAAIEQALAAAQ